MPLGKIRRAHIRAHALELERKGLAPGTRGVVRAVLSSAFGDALEDDLIATDPTIGTRGRMTQGASRREPKKFTVWTPNELRDLLARAEGDRLEALWRLAAPLAPAGANSWGRRGSGCQAPRGTLEIAQQVVPARGGLVISPCKTKGSHRTIRRDAETLAALEAHRERQVAERDLAGDAYADHDLIFCDELGRPINPQRLTEAFASLRTAAAIRPGRLHDIRHSHATHLLTRGVPVHIVSARVGHSSPVVTLSVYAHVLPTSDEKAAEVMADVLAA